MSKSLTIKLRIWHNPPPLWQKTTSVVTLLRQKLKRTVQVYDTCDGANRRTVSLRAVRIYYGRPLSVSGRLCYILPMFIYLFLWTPYSPAQVNRSSRKFYTWWNLRVVRKVTTWIFSWSSLNYRVGQKWRNLAYYQTPPANFLLSRPNAAKYCNSEKKTC